MTGRYFFGVAHHMDPLVKISGFWVIYTSQNVFIFSSKKIDVVTITRYQITFWIFDFSLFDISPKYVNPKIVSRSLYALHDLPKNRGRTPRTRTDGRTSIFKRLPHKSPSGNYSKLDYTRRARVAPLGTFAWKTFGLRQSDVSCVI